MRVLPILFNTDMVRAILEERKSCTRRIIKPQPTNEIQFPLGVCTDGDKNEVGKFAFGSHECGEKLIFCKPPYQPGDILYVRETWDKLPVMRNGETIFYRADGDLRPIEWQGNWIPSIHMPKEAARIWLKVTDVRVERLQEITIDGIRSEGLSSMAVHAGDTEIALKEWELLWNSTIKKSDLDCYGWDANPYVFVIEFERCKKPEES